MKGITFTDESAGDPALRRAILDELKAEGPEKLLKELDEADPLHSGTIEPSDSKRIVRSVELLRSTGRTVAQQTEISLADSKPLDVRSVFLNYKDRQKLYGRINLRVDGMLENGLLDEAEKVFRNRDRYLTAAAAIGYKELFPYLEGISDLGTCVSKLKQASRNYAKRQLTWFRREDAVEFFMDQGSREKVMTDIIRWFDGGETEGGEKE